MLENIKKVDKKLITMIGVIIGVILIIIVIVLILSLTNGGKLSYAKIEKKLESAATKYANNNKDELPKNIGEEVRIQADELVSDGYIKKISEYTDKGVSCDAEVIIGKTPSGYDYVASLDCGKDYKTKFLAEKIKEEVVTSGSGLYEIVAPTESLGTDESGYDLSSNELMSGYAYRGETVNNYIKLNKTVYRIVKIDGKDDFMVVTTNKKERGVYDDRFNTENGKNSGINHYDLSRAQENLATLYSELKDDTQIKQKGVSKNICIGARASDDTTKNGSTECKKVMKNQLYSLLPAYDILNASISNECVKTTDSSCSNYNFLATNNSVWTMTPSTTNSSLAYKINNGLVEEKAERSGIYKYVFYLSSRLVYVSGTGTESDPYIVK